MLLNSLLNGTNLSTQLVTTAAVPNTLSFYGTGQIVLTGTSSATVIGTGAYPNRQTLTFTPSVGVLTLTVTGTVQYAQLETGAFATSFIPTAATTVTRNADVATMTGTNFSNWFNASEGAFAVQANVYLNTQTNRIVNLNDGTTANRFELFGSVASKMGGSLITGGVSQGTISPVETFNSNQNFNFCYGYKQNNCAASLNAISIATTASSLIPAVNQMFIGFSNNAGSLPMSGYIQKIMYWKQRIINAEVQAFSK